ncbi:MAG: hypothetical protein EOM08_01090 [Clostridia bacterium]|nr:hypothetical protein [Clostridia bacterium]NCC75010.1 hypothetical protein [Clostridia bacterium]
MRIRSYFQLTWALLLLTALIAGCSSPSTSTSATSGVNDPTTAASSIQAFTLEELASFDGQDGRKAYIAVDGIVYDVTLLAEWGNKMHAGRFSAGKNYSEEIKNAPHGLDKLLKAVQVGVLSE